MEDAPLHRKIKFEGNRGNNGRDREGAIAAGTKFNGRVLMEAEVFALKPDLIANGILTRGDVRGPFLMCDKKGRGKVGAELGKFKKMIGDGQGGRGRSGEGKRSRLIAHEGAERGGIDSRMVTNIVGEFSGGEMISPVILTNRAVSTKVLF